VRERTAFEFDATGATATAPPTERERQALAGLDADGSFERDAGVKLR
jgi:glutaconate CoA-transferase, subunit B